MERKCGVWSLIWNGYIQLAEISEGLGTIGGKSKCGIAQELKYFDIGNCLISVGILVLCFTAQTNEV